MLFTKLISSVDLTNATTHEIFLTLAQLMAVADDPLGLNAFATKVKGIIIGVGLIIFIISVAIAGIMRMVAFGSERRIMLSNMALTAAVVGLLIMILAAGLQSLLCGAFGNNGVC